MNMKENPVMTVLLLISSKNCNEFLLLREEKEEFPSSKSVYLL